AFVVVASPEPPALREARYFLQRLEQDGMPTAGLVVNRVTPRAAPELAKVERSKITAAVAALDGGGDAERTAAALLRLHVDRLDVLQRERRAVASALHGIDPGALVEVPRFGGDVHDLDGLDLVASRLVGRAG